MSEELRLARERTDRALAEGVLRRARKKYAAMRFRAACAAMQGMHAGGRGVDLGFDELAHDAVGQADALLARLRETEGGAS